MQVTFEHENTTTSGVDMLSFAYQSRPSAQASGTVKWTTGLATALVAIFTAGLIATSAVAGSLKDEPATDPGRKLEWSVNFGVTSDYVFRGISQNAENPAFQAGFDLTYGIFYAGTWASMTDFGSLGPGLEIASKEIDFYAGIKPVLGPVTFDLGVIYYAYPGARDAAGEFDFVEIKLGASTSPVKNLTVGMTGFYSPEYTGRQGRVWTLEGSAAYELPKLHSLTPTFSTLIGYQKGDVTDGYITAGLDDNYLYWNAGLSLALEKLTFDVRYWDTNIAAAVCNGAVSQCDQRFVFSAKITLP